MFARELYIHLMKNIIANPNWNHLCFFIILSQKNPNNLSLIMMFFSFEKIVDFNENIMTKI